MAPKKRNLETDLVTRLAPRITTNSEHIKNSTKTVRTFNTHLYTHEF